MHKQICFRGAAFIPNYILEKMFLKGGASCQNIDKLRSGTKYSQSLPKK